MIGAVWGLWAGFAITAVVSFGIFAIVRDLRLIKVNRELFLARWRISGEWLSHQSSCVLSECSTMKYRVFRLCCKGRAHKYEEKNIKYGILTYVIRQEGFLFILMARLSVLPSHC